MVPTHLTIALIPGYYTAAGMPARSTNEAVVVISDSSYGTGDPEITARSLATHRAPETVLIPPLPASDPRNRPGSRAYVNPNQRNERLDRRMGGKVNPKRGRYR